MAVEYDEDGKVAHAYPFRVAQLERAWTAALAASATKVERNPGFRFDKHVSPAFMRAYSNGDLLVTFLASFTFPYSIGVARVDRAGRPLWFRVAGYNHHVGQIAHADDGEVAVWPAAVIGDGEPHVHARLQRIELPCGNPYVDMLDFVHADGTLGRRVNVGAALRASAYASALLHSVASESLARDACDLMHLNSVHRLGDDAGGSWGLAAGDLVVSLRNLSAFAILDGESAKVKRVVRGGFAHQHMVLHVEAARFVMFDNNGWNGEHGPSRVLLVDLADGRETTIFPHAATPDHLDALYSATRGHISLSPDRRRVIATFYKEGVAVQIRLADRELERVFHSLHDVAPLDQFAEQRQTRAARFRLHGLEFLARTD